MVASIKGTMMMTIVMMFLNRHRERHRNMRMRTCLISLPC